jgi:hypothetical protein
MPRRITRALARGLAMAAALGASVPAWSQSVTERGGRADYLDIVGLNYYPDNQWFLGGSTIPLGHSCYRPRRGLLGEVRAAMAQGVPVEGSCLYPILDYPGFDDDRHCDVRLLGHVGADDRRPVHAALAEEPARRQAIFEEAADAPGPTPLLGSAA